MDFTAIFSFVVANLGLGAAGGVLVFALAVLADDVAGIALAVKQKTFDRAKLGSFLLSEVGSQRTLVVLGAVATAVLAALVSAPLAQSDLQQLVRVLEDVALAAAIAGSAANFAAVAGDLVAKLKAFIA